ncbi:MAG: RlmE family RNA methyltransferase, partial [Zetaproteobacteria bacterium]
MRRRLARLAHRLAHQGMSGKRRRKTRAWLARHRRDAFVRRAKQEGRRSRAAYKLIEMLDRFRIAVPRHARIVDLGAAPGAWSEELARRAPEGVIVAVDLLPMPPIANVAFIQGDFEDPETQARIRAALQGEADLVVSDAAPNLSGVAAVDQARAMRLAESALAFAASVLRPGGAFIVKTFRGEGWDAFVRA